MSPPGARFPTSMYPLIIKNHEWEGELPIPSVSSSFTVLMYSNNLEPVHKHHFFLKPALNCTINSVLTCKSFILYLTRFVYADSHGTITQLKSYHSRLYHRKFV